MPEYCGISWPINSVEIFGLYTMVYIHFNLIITSISFLSNIPLLYAKLISLAQVYQIGRAFTALTMVKNTVDIAREHALQIIHLEQRLHLFLELDVQHWFLKHPTLMHWTNRLYSFVHIPGTIAFLIILYYLTTTRYRGISSGGYPHSDVSSGNTSPSGRSASPSSVSALKQRTFGPHVYEARRRTMAMCNLIAFIVFTLWPCMPPRLLSDPDYNGEYEDEAKSYGFVDTVHGTEGESSVWTTNKFCNQYGTFYDVDIYTTSQQS